MKNIIQARGISKSFQNLQVLKEVDVEIEAKQIVSIVGKSGAGKSTLLHILGTLDTPDTGRIEISGQDITALSHQELSKFRNDNIGFVFQFHNLLPEFSAVENVSLPGILRNKFSRKEAQERAKHLLELVGLEHRLHHKPNQLSGGEQQRVSVARALINDPILLFADEPSGNLDSQNADELHQLFLNIRSEKNLSFVIVTHNKELAQLSDTTFHMADGLLKQHSH